MGGKDLVRLAMLAALTSAGCTYILGVEGEFTAGETSGAGAGSGDGGNGSGAGSTTGSHSGGGNSGGSGAAGGAGGAGGGGGADTLVEGSEPVDRVVVDAMYVYWIANPATPNAEVRRTEKAGDGALKQPMLTRADLEEIAVAEGVIVAASQTEVHRSPLDNPPVTTSASWVAAGTIGGVAVDASGLYYTDNDTLPDPDEERVWWVPHGTTTGEVFEYEEMVVLGGIARNSTNVYWIEDNGIQWAPDASATNETNQAAGTPGRIAVDEGHVCWTATSPSMIHCTSANAGMQPVASVSTDADPSSIAMFDGQVYWTEPDGGRVMRAPVTLDTVEPLAEGQQDPSSVAVDETSVYWTNRAAGAVMRLAR